MPTRKPGSTTSSTDPEDALKVDHAWFEQAELREGDRVLRRAGGRPKLAAPKQAVNLRLDAEVLARFRAGGPGWQSRMNAALRKAVGL